MSAPTKPVVNPVQSIGRNIPYARVWTTQREPIIPADLLDSLYARGFLPGLTDPAGATAPMNEAGLADAFFEVGGEGFLLVSLSSGRGSGCRVSVSESDGTDRPDDQLARRTVAKPKLVYELIAGGPSNSDRTLTENIAEAIMLMTDGVVQIGGLGTKGNRALLHATSWTGTIKQRA